MARWQLLTQIWRPRRHDVRGLPSYAAVPTGSMSAVPRHASSDEQLVDLWLHGRAAHTRAPTPPIALPHIRGPLTTATPRYVRAFFHSLHALAPSSPPRTLAPTK